MNIINNEILQSLNDDKAKLELKVFELIKEFEAKYEGSNIDFIMMDKQYSKGAWAKTGVKAKVVVEVAGQKMEIR